MKTKELDDKTLEKFSDLAGQLSPENLTCDGELSTAEVKRKYSRLVKEWRKLEKSFGRSVTEIEVWNKLWEKRYGKPWTSRKV